jgi:hypothetical protein
MNCTDPTDSDAALTELIAKYHPIQALKIAGLMLLGSSPSLWETGALKFPG